MSTSAVRGRVAGKRGGYRSGYNGRPGEITISPKAFVQHMNTLFGDGSNTKWYVNNLQFDWNSIRFAKDCFWANFYYVDVGGNRGSLTFQVKDDPADPDTLEYFGAGVKPLDAEGVEEVQAAMKNEEAKKRITPRNPTYGVAILVYKYVPGTKFEEGKLVDPDHARTSYLYTAFSFIDIAFETEFKPRVDLGRKFTALFTERLTLTNEKLAPFLAMNSTKNYLFIAPNQESEIQAWYPQRDDTTSEDHKIYTAVMTNVFVSPAELTRYSLVNTKYGKKCTDQKLVGKTRPKPFIKIKVSKSDGTFVKLQDMSQRGPPDATGKTAFKEMVDKDNRTITAKTAHRFIKYGTEFRCNLMCGQICFHGTGCSITPRTEALLLRHRVYEERDWVEGLDDGDVDDGPNNYNDDTAAVADMPHAAAAVSATTAAVAPVQTEESINATVDSALDFV